MNSKLILALSTVLLFGACASGKSGKTFKVGKKVRVIESTGVTRITH